MLVSPLLAGRRVHRSRVVESDTIPAILDAATHERLRALLTAPGRGVHSVASRRLSGLVYCGRCGMAMHAHTMKDRGPTYAAAAVLTFSTGSDPERPSGTPGPLARPPGGASWPGRSSSASR